MTEPRQGNLKRLAWEILKYWEPRRVLYNLLLLYCTIRDFCADGVSDRLLEPNVLLLLVGLALAANLAYCAAHLADLVLQLSRLKSMWLKVRWVLWLCGCWFALFLASQTTAYITGVSRML